MPNELRRNYHEYKLKNITNIYFLFFLIETYQVVNSFISLIFVQQTFIIVHKIDLSDRIKHLALY